MNEPKTTRLSAKRLDLIAATLDLVCAELETTECLASLLQARVEPGWPPGEYDRGAQLFFRDRLQEGGAGVIGWYSWYALRRGTEQQPPVLVGAGGYFGPPSEEGVVEIGFSILPAWQNLGYATELAEGLVRNAFADPRVQRVIAHAVPLNLASRRVLEKCGFRFVWLDEEPGNILYAIARNLGP